MVFSRHIQSAGSIPLPQNTCMMLNFDIVAGHLLSLWKPKIMSEHSNRNEHCASCPLFVHIFLEAGLQAYANNTAFTPPNWPTLYEFPVKKI